MTPNTKDSQEDLINFIEDPKTIRMAVEGSIDKRLAVMKNSQTPTPPSGQTVGGELERIAAIFINTQHWKGSTNRVRIELAEVIAMYTALAVEAAIQKLTNELSVPPDCPQDCEKKHWHHVIRRNAEVFIATLKGSSKGQK